MCLCADWKKNWPLSGRKWIRSRGGVFCFWGLCRRSGASRGAGAAHFQPGRPARPILWDLSSFNSSTAESVIFHPCVCVCVLSPCYVQNDRCGGEGEEGPLTKKCVHWLKYVAALKGGFLMLCRGSTLKTAFAEESQKMVRRAGNTVLMSCGRILHCTPQVSAFARNTLNQVLHLSVYKIWHY